MDARIEYFNVPLMRDGAIVERPAQQTTITKRYTDEGIQFIQSHRDRHSSSTSRTTSARAAFRSKEFERH